MNFEESCQFDRHKVVYRSGEFKELKKNQQKKKSQIYKQTAQ